MPVGYRPDPVRSMSNTAVGIAIASIICIFTPGMAMMLSPLGIIVALLSRDDSCRLSTRAKVSIIICIVVFFLAVLLTALSLLIMINEAGGVDKLYDYLMERMLLYQ